MEKSYVTLEQHVCPVCMKTFDTGNLLLDDILRDVFEKYTVTGYGLCEEHKKVVEDGYVILVEVRKRPQKGQDVQNGEHGLSQTACRERHLSGHGCTGRRFCRNWCTGQAS